MGRPRYNPRAKRDFDKVSTSTLYTRGENFLSHPQARVWSNIFLYDWESDLLRLHKSALTIEGEVKRSRNDYFADFEKEEKHRRLSMRDGIIPNEFYYIVPRGMIDKEEIPEYAGLVEVMQTKSLRDQKYRVMKRAPRLTNDLLPDHFYRELIWK